MQWATVISELKCWSRSFGEGGTGGGELKIYGTARIRDVTIHVKVTIPTSTIRTAARQYFHLNFDWAQYFSCNRWTGWITQCNINLARQGWCSRQGIRWQVPIKDWCYCCTHRMWSPHTDKESPILCVNVKISHVDIVVTEDASSDYNTVLSMRYQ